MPTPCSGRRRPPRRNWSKWCSTGSGNGWGCPTMCSASSTIQHRRVACTPSRPLGRRPIRKRAPRALLVDLFGIIYDTASTSSMHAIAAAREAADPQARTLGASRGLTLYCSEEAHSSIEKGAIAIGIGQQYVRKIPVDAEFRMRPEELAAAVEADIAAGLRPFCVVATVGTTSTTSIDPVPAIADIAARHGLWLHVDAAYAGSAAIGTEFRHILNGAERADSLVANPHKWFFTPFDLSAFYTRRPDILRRAFSLVPEYLRTAQDGRAVN